MLIVTFRLKSKPTDESERKHMAVADTWLISSSVQQNRDSRIHGPVSYRQRGFKISSEAIFVAFFLIPMVLV